VFRHGAHPRSWHQDALAAVLVAGPGGVASHLTAAVLWAFDEIAPGPIEVTVPRARAPRRVPATVHRVDLGPADIDRRPGLIPRTSASRTLIDLAAVLDERALETALDGAERDRAIWRPQLRWHLGQLRPAPGRPGRAHGRSPPCSTAPRVAISATTGSSRRPSASSIALACRGRAPRSTEHRVIGFTYEDVRERPDHVVAIIRAYVEAA
jgi:hypothetical protein